MWFFERIPEDERADARQFAEAGQWRELMELYNRYQVSPDNLTACCSLDKLMMWTQWAMTTGKI